MERASAVMAPVTSLSDRVDVFDQSDLDIVTISTKRTV
jgi:hypothetical protein